MRFLQEKEFKDEGATITGLYAISSDYIYACAISGSDTLVFKINAKDLSDYEYKRITGIYPNQIIYYSGFDGYDIRVIGSEKTFSYATLINLNEKDLSDCETVGFTRKGGWSILAPSGGVFDGCVVCGCNDTYLIAYDTHDGSIREWQYEGGGAIRFLTETKDWLILGVPAVTETEGRVYVVDKKDPEAYYRYTSELFFSLGYSACSEKDLKYAYFVTCTYPTYIWRVNNDDPSNPLYTPLPSTGHGFENRAMGIYLDWYQNTPWCVCIGGYPDYGDCFWTWDSDWYAGAPVTFYLWVLPKDYKNIIGCGFSPHDFDISSTYSVRWFAHSVYKDYGGITMWENPLSVLSTDKIEVCAEYDAVISFDLVAAFGDYNIDTEEFSVKEFEHTTAPSGQNKKKCLTVSLSDKGWRDVGVFAGKNFDPQNFTFEELYSGIISTNLIVARKS